MTSEELRAKRTAARRASLPWPVELIDRKAKTIGYVDSPEGWPGHVNGLRVGDRLFMGTAYLGVEMDLHIVNVELRQEP